MHKLPPHEPQTWKETLLMFGVVIIALIVLGTLLYFIQPDSWMLHPVKVTHE